MNLLEAAWIPIRRSSGARARIAPSQITSGEPDDPIVSVDAPRADFNGALMQFLIGLVQTAWSLGSEQWEPDEMMFHPPTPCELQMKFAPLRDAFEFDGGSARYLQDLTLSDTDNPTVNAISALLIDALRIPLDAGPHFRRMPAPDSRRCRPPFHGMPARGR